MVERVLMQPPSMLQVVVVGLAQWGKMVAHLNLEMAVTAPLHQYPVLLLLTQGEAVARL